jgi:hypothetical protein
MTPFQKNRVQQGKSNRGEEEKKKSEEKRKIQTQEATIFYSLDKKWITQHG